MRRTSRITGAMPVYELPAGDEADDVLKETAIRDVVRHAERVTREISLVQPMASYRARPILLAVLALLSLSLAAYSWVARPAFVFGPSPAAMDPAMQDAHLRFAMYLAGQRVAAYRASNGTLPPSLGDAGEPWPGISYRRVDDTRFELSAPAASGTAIVLRSTDDGRAFVKSALPYLRANR